MADNPGDSSSKKTNPSVPLISLEVEERRKLILESLRAGYPPIPEVFRGVSVNEARYISQFTSGRWRERIYSSSDDSDTAEDEECEPPPGEPAKDESQKLVIYGHDLKCEEYLKESEMIMRWNIVEREQHFPNLEKDYMEKRKAKSQPNATGQASASCTSQSQDIAMEVPSRIPAEASKESSGEGCGEFPGKTKIDTLPESLEPAKSSLDVSMEDPSEIPAEASKDPLKTSEKVQVPPSKSAVDIPPGSGDPSETPAEAGKESPRSAKEVCQDSPSKCASGVHKTSGDLVEETDERGPTSVDVKDAKDISESAMETSGATLRGKRKAVSASSEEDDPDEKRTRKEPTKE